MVLRNLRCDARDALLMARLCDQDDLPGAVGQDGVVQRADILHAEQPQRLAVLAKHRNQFGILHHRLQRGVLPPRREAQDEARIVGMQIEVGHVTGRGRHIAVEVTRIPTHLIQHQVALVAVAQQPDLVLLPAAMEQLDGICQRRALLVDGLIQRHDLAHPRLDVRQLNGRERRAALHLAVEATKRDRVVHGQAGFGKQLTSGHDQQKRERAAVDAAAVAVIHAERLDEDIMLHRVRQLAQLIVDQRGDDRAGPGLVRGRCADIPLQQRADGRLIRAAVRELDLSRRARLCPHNLDRRRQRRSHHINPFLARVRLFGHPGSKQNTAKAIEYRADRPTGPQPRGVPRQERCVQRFGKAFQVRQQGRAASPFAHRRGICQDMRIDLLKHGQFPSAAGIQQLGILVDRQHG